jgi:DNA-binding NarL/FixJ family response regulator
VNIRDKIDQGHRRLLARLERTPYVPEELIEDVAYVGYERSRRPLTEPERQVVECLSVGLTIVMAAEVLGRTPTAVHELVRVARVKLGAKNQAHAVALALRQGLIR